MQPPSPETNPARKWWAMLGIGLGVLMSTLDAGIINISLPTLVEELNATFATVQWVVLSYLLVITALMLSVARLGDMVGKKKVYMVGLGFFTLGSLLSGLSQTVVWLITFRALQGIGAVMLTALGTAIITEVFPPQERGRALGIMGSVVSVGIAGGPMLGGILIGKVGWQSVFLVNVPIGIITFFIVWRVVPPSTPRKARQRFDGAGAMLMAIVLMSYALGMTLSQATPEEWLREWAWLSSWISLGQGAVVAILLSIAGVGLIAFIVVERRVDQPMIDLSMFRNVLFSINLLMGFLSFVTIAGMFLFPFFLELVMGYQTEQVGLMLAVVPVAMGLLAPVAGVLSDRFGSRLISLIGLVITGIGYALVSTLHEDISALGYILRLAPVGIGIGIFMSPNNSAIMGSAPRDRLGVASGLLALTRTLGQTTGVPLLGTLFATQVLATGLLSTGQDIAQAPAAALVAGVNSTMRIVAAIILLATMLAGVALWIDARRKDTVPSQATSPVES